MRPRYVRFVQRFIVDVLASFSSPRLSSNIDAAHGSIGTARWRSRLERGGSCEHSAVRVRPAHSSALFSLDLVSRNTSTYDLPFARPE